MKFKTCLFLLSCLIPTALFAQWKNVGSADYNWGPFYVYTVSLYTETGTYQENTSPSMLTFKYAKPVEGRSFAISLVKEMNSLGFNKESSASWQKVMQEIFPDFSPRDILSYISLGHKGYFILNDTVLPYEFDRSFDQAMLAVWLSPKSNYSQLQDQLLGKEKSTHSGESLLPQMEVKQLNDDDAEPQLPPNFKFENRQINPS